jgi:hypothetical protein
MVVQILAKGVGCRCTMLTDLGYFLTINNTKNKLQGQQSMFYKQLKKEIIHL